MSKIIVLGAGMCGLAAGMLLRRDGHEVTVLERDPEPTPDSPEEAWERWPRDGVTQFRQAHLLMSRGRLVLEEAFPDVLTELTAAGGLRFDLLRAMPPSIADRAPRKGDERLVTVNARRPVVEQSLARAADAEPGLEIRRGVSVTGLLARAGNGGPPHVSGVRTESGEQLDADLVVDATGRRSQLPRWLKAAGAGPIYEEAEDSGFIYYTRFFRSRTGELPAIRAPLVTRIGTFSVITLPADNGTWSVTLYTSSGDQPLKRLRELGPWTALINACPLHAQWLDGEPITEILPMGGIIDRYRRLTVDGRPVVTGIALVGDACAATNPSLGRGMTLGLLHARLLAGAVRDHDDDPRGLTEAWDAITEAELIPWYRETVEEDRARLAEIEALRHGHEAHPAVGSKEWLHSALLAATPFDADAFRAFIANRNCLVLKREIFADVGFVERIVEITGRSEPPPLAGPDRDQLLELLAASPASV